ncbi:MAG: hypothetical protein E7260_10415 [Lachnospiraceae bacterium]|nr:hypothetical protein [Lachnospiraceae bacterium]
MAKHQKKGKRRTGGAIAGIGIVALAGLLALNPFGFGFGEGSGIVTGGETKDNDEKEHQEQELSVTPEPTKEPETSPTPEPTEGPGEVVLKEIAVQVRGKQLLYNGAEAESAQKLAAGLVAEHAESLETLMVRIELTEAVYDTVEELKLALENCGIKYEIAE